jgi:tetratricopeptide (TPR) repeat protein
MFHRQWRYLLALTVCAGLGAGCTKASRAKSLLASADRDFQAQRYEAAEVEYDAVRHLAPLNPIAIRQLGLIYAEEGRLSLAYGFLSKSHQLDAGNPAVQFKLAEVSLLAGKLASAGELAAKYLQSEPTNEEALIILAQASRSPEAAASVRGQIETWARQTPGAAVFPEALGWLDLEQQKPTNAAAELQTALRLDARLPLAYLGMASIYAAQKDYKASEQALKTAADLSPLRSATRLKYAEFKSQTGSPDVAKQILEDITRQAPDYVPAWVDLMKITFAQRQYDECASVVTKILAHDPGNFEAQLQSGNIALATRKVDDAVGQFERMDAGNKKSPQIKYHLALAYLQKGETTKAVASLHEAIALDHNFVPAILLLAEVDVRSGDSTEAVALLTQLVKAQPTNGKAQTLLATAYLVQRQPAKALEVYRQMAKDSPKNPAIPHLIGTVYKTQGDKTHARESFAKALALQPDYFPALEALTDLDVSDKRFADARARVAAEIERSPKAAPPWNLQGSIFWAEGQTNQAESAFSKAIELDPDFTPAYLALAKLCLDAHKEDEALARLTTLLAKTNNATALMEVGTINQQKNHFEAARDAYEKLLTINSNFSPALNNLAFLYAERLGNLDRASQLAQRAHDMEPQNPYTADTLGWVLFKQGNYPRSVALSQEAVEKLPNDPEVAMHLGMTYYMMENEDLARLYLQRAVDSQTDYPSKEQARQSLAFLGLDPAKATPAIIEELRKRMQENPRDPVLLTRLAAIEERQGEPEKAAQAYQTLIQQNPKDIQATVKLAQLYAGPLKDARQAMNLAKSAHDLAPKEPHATALLGELVYQSGDYPWAVSLLQQAADQLTNQPTVLYYLALADYSTGRETEADARMQEVAAAGNALTNLEDARQFLALRAALKDPAKAPTAAAQAQTILQKQPHYLPALMVSALLRQQQGASKEAAGMYAQILNDYPLFTPAMRQLAILYTQSGDNDDKAYELAEKARSSYPDDADLQRTLGILAFRRGDAARSKLLLQQSARQLPNDGELLYYLGMDYYKLKQPNDSKQTLQRALALNLPDKMAEEARRVLAELK